MFLEMKWWDWNDAWMAEAMPLLTGGDNPALYAFWRARAEA